VLLSSIVCHFHYYKIRPSRDIVKSYFEKSARHATLLPIGF
jgi:hypothetical protein